MKLQILNWLAISVTFLTLSCSGEDGLIPQTRCNSAIAIATQTWEVNYYISKTSGGFNTQRTQSFQRNALTNRNGERPVEAASGPDDDGIWWATLPPRPIADEVDQNRQSQERNDPPMLQRSVNYQLQCETGTLLTDALTYREVSRAIRAGQTVQVSYVGNRALQVEAKKDSQ